MFFIPKFVSTQVQRALRRRGFEIHQLPKSDLDSFVGLDEPFREIVRSRLRIAPGIDISEYTTYKAVEYVVTRNIPGEIVECGVHQGRQILNDGAHADVTWRN